MKTSSAPPTMFMIRRSMKAPSAPISAKKATNTSENPATNARPWKKAGRRPVVPSPVAPTMYER